jgi:hypothetical protein
MRNDMTSIRIALASLFALGAVLGGGAYAMDSVAAHATAVAASPAGLPDTCCSG